MSSFVSRVSESQSICVDMTISIRIYKIHSYSKGMHSHFSLEHDQFLLQLAKKFKKQWKKIDIAFRAKYSDENFFYDRIAHRGRFLIGKGTRKPQRKWTTKEEIWLIKNEADWCQSIEHGKNEQRDWKKISILFKKEFEYERSLLSIRSKLNKLLAMQGQNSSAVSSPQDLQKQQESDKWTTEEELWLIKYKTVWCESTVHGTRIRLNWHDASILFKIDFGYEHSAQSFHEKLLELQGRNAFSVSAQQEVQKAQESEQPSVSESSLEELQKECSACATKEHAADSDNCLPANHCFTTVESMRNLGSDLLLEDLYDLGDDPFSGL
jgi:hypothetical protein